MYVLTAAYLATVFLIFWVCNDEKPNCKSNKMAADDNRFEELNGTVDDEAYYNESCFEIVLPPQQQTTLTGLEQGTAFLVSIWSMRSAIMCEQARLLQEIRLSVLQYEAAVKAARPLGAVMAARSNDTEATLDQLKVMQGLKQIQELLHVLRDFERRGAVVMKYLNDIERNIFDCIVSEMRYAGPDGELMT